MNNSRSYKLIEIISAIFILLFLYTALSKFFSLQRFQFTLSRSPIIGDSAAWLSWFLPSFELLTVVLLFIPAIRLLGLYLSFALMFVFTGYIGIMLLSSSRLPCSCGGILQQLSWKDHLIVNTVLTGLAILGCVLEIKRIRSFQASCLLNNLLQQIRSSRKPV